MKMKGVDDGSAKTCGINRTMIVTISNFNKPTTLQQTAYQARMLQAVPAIATA